MKGFNRDALNGATTLCAMFLRSKRYGGVSHVCDVREGSSEDEGGRTRCASDSYTRQLELYRSLYIPLGG